MNAQESIVKWFYRGLNQGDWEAAKAVVDEKFVYHGSERDYRFDEIREKVEQYRKAHPELLFHLDRTVVHGERVGITWSAVTKANSSVGVGTATYRNGKFIEFWGIMPNL